MRHLVCVVLLWAAIPAPGTADEVAIPARDLSAKSPNVAAEYPDFGDLTLGVGRNGFMEWSVSRNSRPPAPSVFPLKPAELADLRKQLNLEGLRNAVRYLADKYPDEYLQAATYLARIEALENRLPTATAQPANVETLIESVAALRQAALVKDNPLLACGRIVFIKRQTFQSSHYYTDYIDGCRYSGGNLCVLSSTNTASSATTRTARMATWTCRAK